jgi:hypothetical protein
MINQSLRSLTFVGTCVAFAICIPQSAHAQGKFDGRWSVVLVTKSGPCDPSYRGAVEVVEGIVQVAGGNQSGLSGRVTARGSVTATGSLGPNYGTASGRLTGNSGGGTWRAQLQDGLCSGVWTATRE